MASIAICRALVLTTLAFQANDAPPISFDFERDQPGQVPSGWVLTTPGAEAVVSSDMARSGRQCVRMRLSDTKANQGVAVLLRTLDAAAYRGRSVRLHSALRVEQLAQDDRIQLWLRVDREGNKPGFFDNMDDRPVRRRDWSEVEIVGDVAADASQIVYGLLLFGKGTAWVDDVRLEVVGKARSSPAESPRALTDQGMRNLIAFARLLGYVRHFHPSDEAAKADWDAFAVAGIRAIEPAKGASDLARRLEDLFRPLAPTVRVYVMGAEPAVPSDHKPPPVAQSILAWEHDGYGGGALSDRFSMYRSSRRRWLLTDGKRPATAPDPSHPFRGELGGGVFCEVPLALYADDKGTLPHGMEVAGTRNDRPDSTPVRYSGDDRATRLADVILAWNILQHFYPYFDVVRTDWPKALRTALGSAATDADAQAFLATLRRMVAGLKDGHGRVFMSGGGDPGGCPPLAWDWVEGRLVITVAPRADSSGASKPDVKPGETIQKIDGRPVADALADVEGLVSAATPQWLLLRSLQQLGAGEPGSLVSLEVGEGPKTRTVRLKRVGLDQRPPEFRPAKIKEIRPGIMYVDIGRIDDSDLKSALPELERARGIVFDFRGYPEKLSPAMLFQHLIDKVTTSPQWHIPLVTRPDREKMVFKRLPGWMLFPIKPRLTAKLAFVTDGRAISYAESCLGIIENYKLGAIVGGPTAGTNGNVNPIALPGGYRVNWTGMRVLKHDGSRHHGVGIIPTVPVSRTIAGVAAGRDELLEKAVEVVGGG